MLLYTGLTFPLPSGEVLSHQAVWLVSGIIQAVGPEEQIRKMIPPQCPEIPLKGLVLPGFVDAHCHLPHYGLNQLRSADLRFCGSIEELLERLQEHSRVTPLEWVLGGGFDQDRLVEGRFPTRQDLDQVFPDRPIAITRVCGHVMVGNTEALRRAGIDSGDGVLREGEADLLRKAIPPPREVEWRRAIEYAQEQYLRVGFTGAHIIVNQPEEVRALQTLHRQGRLHLRVRILLPYSWLDSLEKIGLQRGWGDESLRFLALKIFSDGSLGARTAALTDPYSDAPCEKGVLLVGENQLAAMIQRAYEAGWPCAVHAIGDRAVRTTVNAFARNRSLLSGLIGRIEHASVSPPEVVEKMRDLSLIAVVQPQFLRSDFWVSQRLGPERVKWVYPFRSMLSGGVTLAGSTDAPVEVPNPWEVVFCALNRPSLNPEEALTLEEALGLLTTGAGQACGEGSRWGRLEPGYFADFLLLPPDTPWPPSSWSLRPKAVVVAGRIVYQQQGDIN